MAKKIVLSLTVLFCVVSYLAGCSEASKPKMQEAKNSTQEAVNSMKEAANSLAEAQRTDANVRAEEATKDWNSFKEEMNRQIVRNEAEIKELRQKIAAADAKERARLNGELDKLQARHNEQKKKLEAKNEEMKKRVGEEVEKDKQRRTEFQREFARDSGELTKALKNFWTDNVR